VRRRRYDPPHVETLSERRSTWVVPPLYVRRVVLEALEGRGRREASDEE
jgi:hypothetical protein